MSRLGEVKANWRQLTLKFNWEGRSVKIQRDLSLTSLEISFKTLMKSIEETRIGNCIKLNVMEEQGRFDDGE